MNKKQEQARPTIAEDSVLHDDSLNIDVKGDGVKVLADDVQLDNNAITVAAVIKNPHSNDNNEDKGKAKSDDDVKTHVFDERVEQILSDDKEVDNDVADKKTANEDKMATPNDRQDEKTKNSTEEQSLSQKVAAAASQMMEEFKNTSEALVGNLSQADDDVKDTSKQGDKKSSVADVADKAQQKSEQMTSEVKAKAEDIKDKAEDKVEEAKAKAEDIKGKALDKVEEVKDKAEDIKDEALDKVTEIKAKAEDKVEDIKAKAEDIKGKAEDKVEEIKEEFLDKKEQLTEQAYALKEDVTHRAEQVIQDVKDGLGDVKDKITDKVDAISADILDKKDELLDKKDELLDKVNARNEQAIKDAKKYQETHKAGGIVAGLGTIGAYLGSLYQGKSEYEPADIQKEDSRSDVFHRQGAELLGNALGAKAVSAQGLVKKFVPQDKLNAVSEAVYEKVADWAQKWALAELNADGRFEQLSAMSNDAKERFADDIANQNRALATFGGLSGFLGLKGVVIDTAWLLLISLKSVYQLALIYDKPLSGKEGAQKAYGILACCDLEKLQDKQLMMTALALGNVVLVNAQSTSIADELQKLGQKYQNRSYSKGFEELSKYINLDNLNPSWLHWLLPTTSTVISAHYNNELIAEVLGVARATFAHKETKLLEDKTTAKTVDSKTVE